MPHAFATLSTESFLVSVARMKSIAAATCGFVGARRLVESRSMTRTAGQRIVLSRCSPPWSMWSISVIAVRPRRWCSIFIDDRLTAAVSQMSRSSSTPSTATSLGILIAPSSRKSTTSFATRSLQAKIAIGRGRSLSASTNRTASSSGIVAVAGMRGTSPWNPCSASVSVNDLKRRSVHQSHSASGA